MIDAILRARSAVLVIFTLLLLVSAWGASFLTIDPNNRAFYSERHEHYAKLIELEERFGSNTNLLFLIVSDGSLSERPGAADAIRWLADQLWRIDRVVAVSSIANHPHVSSVDDDLYVGTLLEYVCPSEGRCLEDRLSLLKEVKIKNRLVGEQGQSFAVVADVDLLDPTADVVTAIAREAEEIKAEFGAKFPELGIYLTGGVPMMQAFFDAAQEDSQSLMWVALFLLTVSLYVFLGGVIPTVFMILLGAASVLVTMGFAGWGGYVINTATATVPLIVLTLVVAAAMHPFLHIVREEGMSSNEGVRRAVRVAVAGNWRPVLLTAATTILGLSSLIFVTAPPIQELGLFTCVGVASGALFSLTVVPCLFTYLPSLSSSNWLRYLQSGMNRYAKWMEAKRPSMMWVAALMALAMLGLGQVRFDEDFVRYFSPDTSFRKDTEAITEHLASPYHIDVVYDSGQTDGIYLADSVADLQDLVSFLRSDRRVANAASILDVFSEISAAMGGDSDLSERSSDELAQYFLSYELSLNVGQSARDLLDADGRRARVSTLLSDVSMAEIRDLADDIEVWALGRGIDDRIMIAGEGMPTAYLSSETIKEMGLGIATSILLSAILIGLYFRKVVAAVGILLAMVLPLLVGFGLWAWIEPEMGMAATLVVAITIGVIIDDTIHLTYRYVDSIRNFDLTPWGAAAYCVHKTGTAIVVTSIVLSMGLLVLLDSKFTMNSTFGVCASIVIIGAVIYNLTLGPHLLRKLETSAGAVRGIYLEGRRTPGTGGA